MKNPRSFRLASSEFPSGVAWLLNFFVELDVLVYGTKSIEETWVKREDGSYTLTEAERIRKQWIPALHDSPSKVFRDDVAVRWSHEYPLGKQKNEKVILLVRDGRDAAYSSFKRYQRDGSGMPFLDWLRSKYGPMGLTPPEIWALLNYLWIAHTSAKDLLIVRFDDLKTNPETTVPQVLAFMELAADQSSVARAIASSSIERAKQAEESYKQEYSDFPNTVNRRGALKEWMEVYEDAELKAFDGFPSVVLEWFGYEVSAQKDDYKKLTAQTKPQATWDQTVVLSRLPILTEEYKKTPHLEKYWRRFKRRQLRIDIQGRLIIFLKKGRWIALYALIKWMVDLYRACRKKMMRITTQDKDIR